jgi:hypothetical protein
MLLPWIVSDGRLGGAIMRPCSESLRDRGTGNGMQRPHDDSGDAAGAQRRGTDASDVAGSANQRLAAALDRLLESQYDTAGKRRT